MKNYILAIVLGINIILSLVGNVFAEETVGCPHDVGKGKFKIRSKITHTAVAQCYSDEVWKALHGNSPYLLDYDKMVNLPDGWHQNITKIAVGFEYGIIDRLSVGVFSRLWLRI